MNCKDMMVQAVEAMANIWNSKPVQPDSKFHVGDKVKFSNLRGELFSGTVIGVNDTGPSQGGVEYAISGYPYLVWEDELRSI